MREKYHELPKLVTDTTDTTEEVVLSEESEASPIPSPEVSLEVSSEEYEISPQVLELLARCKKTFFVS